MKESLARSLSPRAEALQTSAETAYAIVSACTEANGIDTTILDVSKVFDLSDYFIVVSGRSDRQVQGIANRILATMNERGLKPLTVEGVEQGHWVLMDWGDVVVHIFYEPLREHYDVEGLWIRAEKISFKKDKKKGVVALKAA